MLRKLLISCLSLTALFTMVYSQTTDNPKEAEELQIQFVRVNQEAKEAGNQPAMETLSKQLDIPLADLEAERKSTGFGVGELFIAHSMADASGLTLDEIVAEFKSGKGWGVIAKEHDLKLGPVVSGLKRTGDELKSERLRQERVKQERVKQERIRENRGEANRAERIARPRGALGGSKAKGAGRL